MTVVVLKYNVAKYKEQQTKQFNDTRINSEKYAQSLEALENYEQDIARVGVDNGEINWLINSRNVAERLSILKESYKLVQSFRKRKARVNNMENDLKLSTYLSEDEGSSGTESQNMATPKRSTRRSLTTT